MFYCQNKYIFYISVYLSSFCTPSKTLHLVCKHTSSVPHHRCSWHGITTLFFYIYYMEVVVTIRLHGYMDTNTTNKEKRDEIINICY